MAESVVVIYHLPKKNLHRSNMYRKYYNIADRWVNLVPLCGGGSLLKSMSLRNMQFLGLSRR